MNYDEKIDKMLEIAETVGGKIQLFIAGRANSGDYIDNTCIYTPEQFREWDIRRIFKIFRSITDKIDYIQYDILTNEEYYTKLEQANKENQAFIKNLFDDTQENWEDELETLSFYVPQVDDRIAYQIDEVKLYLITNEI